MENQTPEEISRRESDQAEANKALGEAFAELVRTRKGQDLSLGQLGQTFFDNTVENYSDVALPYLLDTVTAPFLGQGEKFYLARAINAVAEEEDLEKIVSALTNTPDLLNNSFAFGQVNQAVQRLVATVRLQNPDDARLGDIANKYASLIESDPFNNKRTSLETALRTLSLTGTQRAKDFLSDIETPDDGFAQDRDLVNNLDATSDIIFTQYSLKDRRFEDRSINDLLEDISKTKQDSRGSVSAAQTPESEQMLSELQIALDRTNVSSLTARDLRSARAEFQNVISRYGNNAVPFLKEALLDPSNRDQNGLADTLNAVAEIKDVNDILEIMRDEAVIRNPGAYESLARTVNRTSIALRLNDPANPLLRSISERLLSLADSDEIRKVSVIFGVRDQVLRAAAITGTREAQKYIKQEPDDLESKKQFLEYAQSDDISSLYTVSQISLDSRIAVKRLSKNVLANLGKDYIKSQEPADTIIEVSTPIETNTELTDEEKQEIDQYIQDYLQTDSLARDPNLSDIARLKDKAIPYLESKLQPDNPDDPVVGLLRRYASAYADAGDLANLLSLTDNPAFLRSDNQYSEVYFARLSLITYGIRKNNPDDPRLREISEKLSKTFKRVVNDDEIMTLGVKDQYLQEIAETIALTGTESAVSFLDNEVYTSDVEIFKDLAGQRSYTDTFINFDFTIEDPRDEFQARLISVDDINEAIRIAKETALTTLESEQEIVRPDAEQATEAKQELTDEEKQEIDAFLVTYNKKLTLSAAELKTDISRFGGKVIPYVASQLEAGKVSKALFLREYASAFADAGDLPELLQLTSNPKFLTSSSSPFIGDAITEYFNKLQLITYGIRKNNPEDPRLQEISESLISTFTTNYPKKFLIEGPDNTFQDQLSRVIALTGTESAQAFINEYARFTRREGYFNLNGANTFETAFDEQQLSISNPASPFTEVIRVQKSDIEKAIQRASETAPTESLESSQEIAPVTDDPIESQESKEAAERLRVLQEIVNKAASVLRRPEAKAFDVPEEFYPGEIDRKAISIRIVPNINEQYVISFIKPGALARSREIPSQSLSIKFLNAETQETGELYFSDSETDPFKEGKTVDSSVAIAKLSTEWVDGKALQRSGYILPKSVDQVDLERIQQALEYQLALPVEKKGAFRPPTTEDIKAIIDRSIIDNPLLTDSVINIIQSEFNPKRIRSLQEKAASDEPLLPFEEIDLAIYEAILKGQEVSDDVIEDFSSSYLTEGIRSKNALAITRADIFSSIAATDDGYRLLFFTLRGLRDNGQLVERTEAEAFDEAIDTFFQENIDLAPEITRTLTRFARIYLKPEIIEEIGNKISQDATSLEETAFLLNKRVTNAINLNRPLTKRERNEIKASITRVAKDSEPDTRRIFTRIANENIDTLIELQRKLLGGERR